MKHLVPIHVANYVGSPGSVQSGFKKFYLKNGYFKLYNGASEDDVVLDRPLDGFTPLIGTITAADTVLTAIEKLDYAISNVTTTTSWGTITGTITAQSDLMSYLSSNYYPSSNPAGFVSNTFVAANYYPLTANPAGYLTQQSVLEYPSLASFPVTGAANTIYIATDTDIAYYWDGATYVVVTTSTSGISGFGIINRLAKFTPNGSTIGSSKIIEFVTGATVINLSNRPLLGGNSILSIQRAQSQIDFILGNPALGQSSYLISDNDLAGFEIRSKGELSLKTGSTYSNEGLKIYTSGQLKLTQTPATGTTSDFILLRDASGNLKQIAYPTIPAGTVTNVTATSPITSSGGATPNISTSMNTNKLIGRSTAGTGVMEEITIGTGLTLTGGTLNATASGGILHGTASGTDTYSVTITGPTSYNDGDAYLIRFTNGNTTSCTLNINGLGAIPLYRNNDGALLGGDIADGAEMLCVYNSTTNRFQTIGISPNTLISYVTNDDSVTITKGQVVYAFSGTGDRMTVKLANNTGDATSAQTVGLVWSTSIAPNQKGFIMMQGLLDGLSILPTSTWNDGDPVYLGATPGSITKIKPYAPNHLVYLGVVTTASPGSSGRMYVRVQNGYELDELHNVQAQSPSYKDVLWYDNTVSPAQWKTASLSTILGYTPPNLGLVQAMIQGLHNIF